MSSIRALREEGHYARYVELLPGAQRDAILNCVAPQWMPVELAVVHYDACNRLGLSSSQMLEMGSRVAKHAQGTFVKTIVAFVTSAGATPWTMLAQGRRMWERAWVGSGLSVVKLGPKEARIEIVGCPCARIAYFRGANRGILQSVVQILSTRAYVNEVPRLSGDTSLAYKLQWA